MGMATITIDEYEIPAEVLTLEGFRNWYGSLGEGRGPRASFVGGNVFIETYAVSPQGHRTHEPLVRRVNATLMNLADQAGAGTYFWPPSWISDVATGLSTEPDGFFSTFESLRAGTLRINPRREHELLGRPDFVFEAVSRSSSRKDLVELRELYAKAGVPEYWIADGRKQELSFTVLLLKSDRTYREQPPDADGFLASPTWRRAFRLRRSVNEAGMDDIVVDVSGSDAGPQYG